MTAEAAFWLAACSLLLTCFSAVGARCLREFSRHKLEEICRRRATPTRLGEILVWHDEVALGVECLQVLATAVLVSSSSYWVWWRLAGSAGWVAIAAGAAAGGAMLLAVEIWFPRAIVRLWTEPILFATWKLWRVTSQLLSPLVIAGQLIDVLLHRLAGRVPEEPSEEFYEEEIRTVVTEGHREGLLEEDAREMIEGVIELGDADVSQIMTPRTDMMSIRVGASLDDAAAFVVSAGHSRIPVFEKNRDDIVGILYIKDLLSEILKEPTQRAENVADLLRPPYFVPETKPVNALLQEFQKNRNHMAIVLDEYGGVSGLVTIEDVLEEIVGEIADEHDEDLVEGIKTIDERTAEALARVHIDEVNERLGVALPDDGEFDTIGGLVFSRLGHVPKPGEEVVINDVRLIVVDVTRRRIERLRIEVLDPSRIEPA